MTRLQVLAAAAMVILAALFSFPATAATIDWELSGVTFDDGGTASGTFSTDSTSGDVIDFDITTTAGSTLGGAVYDSTSLVAQDGIRSPYSFLVTNFSTGTYINLEFVSPLTGGATDDLILSGNSYECDLCSPVRNVVSGEALSLAPTPVPAALPLFVTALAGLGVFGFLTKGRKNKALAT